MEIQITKEVSKIQLKEDRDFIDIAIDGDGCINDITSNYTFEYAIQILLEMGEKDFSNFLLLLNEGRKQIKLMQNNEL